MMIDLKSDDETGEAYVRAAVAGTLAQVVRVMRAYPYGLESLRVASGLSDKRFDAVLTMKANVTVREVAGICIAAGVWPSIDLT